MGDVDDEDGVSDENTDIYYMVQLGLVCLFSWSVCLPNAVSSKQFNLPYTAYGRRSRNHVLKYNA